MMSRAEQNNVMALYPAITSALERCVPGSGAARAAVRALRAKVRVKVARLGASLRLQKGL
jgi:hypothetical protein